MSTSQRARSGVPLDQRSALASVPGVPAWGAVAIAGGASFLGFVIDAARGTELTSAFACFYIIGVVAAVVLVRYRGLFTALVQAPLILFAAVPLAYQYFTENPGTGVKDILLNVAIPLVNRFPLMLLGTVLAIGIGGARIYLKRQSTHAPTRSVRARAKQTRDRTRDSRPKTKSAPDSARSPEDRVSGRGAAYDGQPTDSRRRSTDARRPGTEGRGSRASAEGRPSTEGRRARRERVEPSYDRRAADMNRPDMDRPDMDRADPYRPEPVDVERAPLPPRRAAPGQPQSRAPRPTDPYSAPRSAPASAHVPPHPVPQVRYRDRTEP